MGQIDFEVDLSKVTTNVDGSVTVGDPNSVVKLNESLLLEMLTKKGLTKNGW